MKQTTAALMALTLAQAAGAYTLDFGSSTLGSSPNICATASAGFTAFTPCGNGGVLNQQYGDVPGIVDVTYSDGNVSGNSLLWWDGGYNNLAAVVYASGSDGSSRGVISLAPNAGLVVTLRSFDVGAYNLTTRPTNLQVFAIGNPTPLFSFSGNVGNGAVAATPFSFNLASTTGIRIEWFNSAYNVGIDNIVFDVTPVPEPATWGLMALGLALVATHSRRRRQG